MNARIPAPQPLELPGVWSGLVKPDLHSPIGHYGPVPQILTDHREPLVFVDMDGVLVDFVAQVCLVLGCPENRDQVYHVPNWGDIHEGVGLSAEVMWQEIDRWGSDFWANAPWMPNGIETMQAAERMGNVYLCSSPARNPASAAGKLEWIRRCMPKYEQRYVLVPEMPDMPFGPRGKALLAKEDRILIDDNPKNVREFIGAGGTAYLVTHPYNEGSDLPTFWGTKEVS